MNLATSAIVEKYLNQYQIALSDDSKQSGCGFTKILVWSYIYGEEMEKEAIVLRKWAPKLTREQEYDLPPVHDQVLSSGVRSCNLTTAL